MKKWIPVVITSCLLFVSAVTVGILFAMGVIGREDEKFPLPSPDLMNTPKEAGLYDSDGKMTRTWEELLTEGMITVEDHSLQYADVTAELPGQLIIGEGITSIGESAFCDCGGLMGITVPDSVMSIGGSAFRNCVGLTSITIPDGVVSIGEKALNDIPVVYYNGTASGSPWGAKAVRKH